MPTIRVNLPYDEKAVLDALVASDLRTPEQTLRWLLRNEADRRGLSINSKETGLKPGSSPVSQLSTVPNL